MMDKVYALLAKKDAWMASDEGATAVEYGIMVAGIAALIIAVVFILGGTVRDLFQGVSSTIANGGVAPE